MGLFGKIMGAMGFQSSNEQVRPKKKEKNISTKASYNLKKKEVVEKIDNIDGIKVYYPEEYEQCKKLYEFFKAGDPIIVNFSYTNDVESEIIKAYFAGICDATGSQFVNISDDKMYILLPEGVEIEN